MEENSLIKAMHERDLVLLEHLLAEGEDPNSTSDDGDYPLQVAYRYALHEAIGYTYLDRLITGGADLNRQFIPPLHGACHASDVKLVKYLLEHGADPLMEDGDGKVPLDWAQEQMPAGKEIRNALILKARRQGEQRTDGNHH